MLLGDRPGVMPPGGVAPRMSQTQGIGEWIPGIENDQTILRLDVPAKKPQAVIDGHSIIHRGGVNTFGAIVLPREKVL